MPRSARPARCDGGRTTRHPLRVPPAAQEPGFAAIAVITLGLGIGAAAAMFGLIQGVLLSPPPYADPGRRLISPVRTDGRPLHAARPSASGRRGGRRERSSRRRSTAGRSTSSSCLTAANRWRMVVTPGYFRALGCGPSWAGSSSTRNWLVPTAAVAIILGYDLWQRKFNGDPNIVGRTIRMSRMPAPLPVVGVMPRGIRFLPDPGASSEPNYDLNAYVDFWFGVTPDESRPTSGAGNAIARLRDGATLTGAQTEITALSAGLAQSDSALQGISATVTPVQDVLNRDGRRLLVPLFGSVALVFFIACANVSGLLLTRGLQRHPELPMRSALGAGRWRLFRQALTEASCWRLPAPRSARHLRRHRHSAEGDCGSGSAAGGRCPHRLAGLRLWFPRCGHRRRRRGIANSGPRITPGPDPGFERHAHDRRPQRAPSSRRRCDRADCVDGCASRGCSPPHPHRSQPRSDAARLRHREHPGDDGDDHVHGAAEVGRVPQAGARTGGVGAWRDPRGVRVGCAADRQQSGLATWRSPVSPARRSWPIASAFRCGRSRRIISTSWAWPSWTGARSA